MPIDPQAAIDLLKELRALTADENGAQRLAWTPTWLKARDWFQSKLYELPIEHHLDAAGNSWATLAGASDKTLILGSHLDSVPNGGWLDGCLGVIGAYAVLRRIAEQYNGKPPITIRLVDWADEEGARFGRSLFGSSAFAGTHSIDQDRGRTDASGIRLEDALATCNIPIDSIGDAQRERANASAYIELHIEQGPVLESMGLPLAAVLGTKGVERHTIIFHGQEAHSGSTPMRSRHDALAAAAKLVLKSAPSQPNILMRCAPSAASRLSPVSSPLSSAVAKRHSINATSMPGARHHVSRSSAEEHSVRRGRGLYSRVVTHMEHCA